MQSACAAARAARAGSARSASDRHLDMLGTAARVAVTKERTTMIATGDHSEAVTERIKKIRAEIEIDFDSEKAEERIAKLGGAIGRIKVGAATETELKDKKLLYEDALNNPQLVLDRRVGAHDVGAHHRGARG